MWMPQEQEGRRRRQPVSASLALLLEGQPLVTAHLVRAAKSASMCWGHTTGSHSRRMKCEGYEAEIFVKEYGEEGIEPLNA